MSFNMIKTCHKRPFLVLLLLNLHQMRNTSFDWFSMDLPLSLREAYSRKLSYNKLNLVKVISIKFIITPHIGYTEFHKNFWKMTNCLIWEFTLLNWSILILLLPLKWKLDLFTLKGMCVKIQKIMSCKAKL